VRPAAAQPPAAPQAPASRLDTRAPRARLSPQKITTDVVALLDEWAARFFEELDYVREGENATRFAAQMAADLPQVVVPRTYSDYTSRRVLTTEWLDGEKLSQSKARGRGRRLGEGRGTAARSLVACPGGPPALCSPSPPRPTPLTPPTPPHRPARLPHRQADDVGTLVNVGVICYLKQLLDTGFFHADPHPGAPRRPRLGPPRRSGGAAREAPAPRCGDPRLLLTLPPPALRAGNLIRTPDGRLAILDFGLMTEVQSAPRGPLLALPRYLPAMRRAFPRPSRLLLTAVAPWPLPPPRPPTAQVDDDIKYGMIEAISHLIHRDYTNIVQVGGGPRPGPWEPPTLPERLDACRPAQPPSSPSPTVPPTHPPAHPPPPPPSPTHPPGLCDAAVHSGGHRPAAYPAGAGQGV
jgi:hypothetical protein